MKKINRRDFLSLAAGSAAAATLAGCVSELAEGGKIPAKKPNIIYILADDLGYGDLGCYGQKEIATPNLDKMAAEGIRFTQHYAGNAVCAPSRCCLMTGMHGGHARIRANSALMHGGDARIWVNSTVPLEPCDVTIAELLKKAGYTTALVGKWGLGEEGTTGIPNRKGFDYFYGYLNQIRAHNYYPEWLWRNQEKIKLANEVVFAKHGYAKGIGTASTNRAEYSPELFAKEALNFVARNKEQPFFLYLACTIPHANDEASILNRHGMEVPDYGIYKDKNWPEVQKGYAAAITWMDKDIGRMLAELQSLGLDKNTLVMFSSDNGPHKEGGFDPTFFNSSGSLRGIKGDLYEGGIRVPMIAYWPGKIKPGSVTDFVSAFWDVLPTCTELAGVASPKNIDGISMVPTLLGRPKKQKEHKFLYWEFHEHGPGQAVRMGDWKAVRLSPHEPLELYNLAEDRAEKHNIADMHPDVVAVIKAYLKTARTDSEYWPNAKFEGR